MRFAESNHQQALFRWAKRSVKKYPELELLYSIPNGANVNDKNRLRLWLEGLKKGIPDVHLPIARGPFNSLYIELKSKKGILSDHQNSVIKLLEKAGSCCIVSRDITTSITAIESYLRLAPKMENSSPQIQ